MTPFLISACDHVNLCRVVVSKPLIMDSTPPIPGLVSVTFMNCLSSHNGNILVEWHGFIDPESGVELYQLGIGSLPLSQDSMAFKIVSGSSYVLQAENVGMEDGKHYYFQIKVSIS